MVALLLVGMFGGHAFGTEDVKGARRHFDKGTKLYDLGKYDEAAVEYEEAYKLKADPALLFNIGQAYRASGKISDALTAYKSYLRKVPDAPNRADVEGHIATLQHTLDEQSRPAPVPLPVPEISPPPAASPGAADLTVSATPPAHRTPVYKKWWLWTAVGGVVVAGVLTGVLVATVPKNASSPDNTYPVSLR